MLRASTAARPLAFPGHRLAAETRELWRAPPTGLPPTRAAKQRELACRMWNECCSRRSRPCPGDPLGSYGLALSALPAEGHSQAARPRGPVPGRPGAPGARQCNAGQEIKIILGQPPPNPSLFRPPSACVVPCSRRRSSSSSAAAIAAIAAAIVVSPIPPTHTVVSLLSVWPFCAASL